MTSSSTARSPGWSTSRPPRPAAWACASRSRRRRRAPASRASSSSGCAPPPTPRRHEALLAALVAHHRDGRAGFSLLPQGAATNNTEDKPADLRLGQDADASYRATFTADGTPIAATAWSEQRDGARLAAALGLPLDALQGVIGVNGADQIEARAMHTALFPGTFGYFLHDMIGDALPTAGFDFIRSYMLDEVSGRGPIPALRIGAQPYGVLPDDRLLASCVRRTGRTTRRRRARLDPGVLATGLRVAERDWAAMATRATWLGQGGDPHRALLDTLGQHPASVEFHRRETESIEEHVNRLHMASGGAIAEILRALETIFRTTEIPQLLARLGVPVTAPLPISQRIFSGRQALLGGPVIDDVPLSETDPVRAYTDRRAQLSRVARGRRRSPTWMSSAGKPASRTTLRRAPCSIFCFASRCSAGIGTRAPTACSPPRPSMPRARWPIAATRPSSTSGPTRPARAAGHSSMRLRRAAARRLFGSTSRSAADLRAGIGTGPLREQVEALASLQDLPTARLERLFVEHLDCLSFRPDAWRTGLAFTRLKQMRGGEARDARRSGVLLGAYGWVENCRPRSPLQPFELPEELAAAFPDVAGEPLSIDPANQGFIHAPSLGHAVTAAVLRNGHMSMADPAGGDELSVNLSSERVRRALDIMQGMREGQSLAALLGYQFERGLHERFAPLELDKFIQPLRNQFPLDANRIAETAQPPAAADESITARNVIDGRKFADNVKGLSAAARHYPYALPDLPGASPAEAAAIDTEADRLLDTLDAVSDVAIAESVHQAAKGNFERAAGMLDAFARGASPPEPEVVRTPRTGVTLTHRVAVHFDPDVANPPPVATPRALAEPRIDDWLRRHLPPLESIACSVTYFDRALDRISDPIRISIADGLAAIDLCAMLPTDTQQGSARSTSGCCDSSMRRTAFRPMPSRELTTRLASTRRRSRCSRWRPWSPASVRWRRRDR